MQGPKRVTEGQVSSSVSPDSCPRALPHLGEQTHTHQQELEAEISKTQDTQNPFAFMLIWNQIPTRSKPRKAHTLLQVQNEVFWICQCLALPQHLQQLHSTPQPTWLLEEVPSLPRAMCCSQQSHAGGCSHCFGGHRAALLSLHQCLLPQRKLAAKTSWSD